MSRLAAPNINRGARLLLPGKQIVPRPGDHVMECGNCQGKVFGVFVRQSAMIRTSAHVVDVVCTGCGKTWDVNNGVLVGDGKVRPNRKGEGKVLVDA